MTPPPDLVFIEERPMAGRVLRMTPDAVIGRDACDIVLPDPEVSRRHAVLRRTEGRLAIQDLQSLNGTFVNGARIGEATPLEAGDTVQLGNTVWHVRRPDPGSGTP